ncbi:MAG: DUF6056 family protein [Lachnospiraceae bacterium]|nr:DUF6056 family protein [Lachnospiraceae bacterium]
MSIIKKIISYKVDKRLFLIGVTIILIGLLYPVYRLAFYATPFYDDYNYAWSVKVMWEASPSFKTVVEEAAWVVGNTYRTWQGTYSSVFLMALMPATYGFGYYWIGIVAIITSYVAGIFAISYTLTRCVAGAKRIDALIASELITIIVLELFYSAQQGFYWYNGSVHYSFAHGIMLIMLSVAIRYVYSEKHFGEIACLIVCSVLGLILGGVNFVTGLQGLLFLTLIIALGWLRKKQKTLFLLIPEILYLFGLIVSIAAPGNANRQASYATVSKGVFEAVMCSFASAFKNIPGYTGLIIIPCIILIVPIFSDILEEKKMKFALPGVVSLLSFCLFATGYTPSWYGMGEEGLARIFCAVKTTFLLLLFVNMFYWMGWLKGKINERERIYTKHYYVTYILAVLLILGCFSITKDKAGSFLSYGCFYYIHTGEANNYYMEQLARDEYIQSSGADVVLEPLVWRPWFLCKKNELSSDPAAQQNVAAAMWYQKSSIRVNE